MLDYLAFAKIASFKCIKVVCTGSVESLAEKLFLSEWLGYGISGQMLGGLWDGQPRALESCGSGRDLGGVGRTRAQCALEACQGLRPNQGNQPGKGATKARVLLKPQEPGSSEEFMKMHKKYERQRVL